MNNESRTLWLSLFSGVFAAFLIFSYSQEKKKEYDKTYGTTEPVLIAKRNIAEMDTIDDSMLEIDKRPKMFVEPGAIADPELAVGQVAAVPIKKGEQILGNKLLIPGPNTGIALQISPSKRAVTIPVDDVRSVAKLIRPGDRVDIYAAIDIGKGINQRREVAMIMSDVVVLATGSNIMNNIPRSIEQDSSGKAWIQPLTTIPYSNITIEANSKEAQDLIYLMAASPGNIFLTLRNPNDRKAPDRMPSSNAESLAAKTGVVIETAPAIQQPQNRPLPSRGR